MKNIFKKKEVEPPTYQEEKTDIEETAIKGKETPKKSDIEIGAEFFAEHYSGIADRQAIINRPTIEGEAQIQELLFAIWNELRILNRRK